MPGFLYKEDPVNIPVYQHPMDLMGRALMIRDAKAREGLSMIRSQYDSLINTPLTNETNQLEVRAATEQAMSKLKGLASTDLSLPENQGAALSVFDNVLNNKNYLTDMAFTRHMSKQKQIIDETKKKNPDQWAPMNEYVVMKEEQKYRSADPNSVSPNFVTYTPYTNVDKLFQDIAKEVEADEDQFPTSVTIDGMPIQGSISVTQRRQDKIMARLQGAMAQDPRIAQQMAINYTYLRDSGAINPNFAISKIEGAIKNLRDQFVTGKNPTSDTAKQATERITGLQAIVDKIKANPSGFEEYYGFSQFTQEYLQETSAALSYTKTKPVTYDPLGIKMFESKLRRQESAMESELRIKEERLKSSMAGGMGSYTFDDPRGFANNEYLTLLNKLQTTGQLSTTENDKFVRALMGGVAESKTNPGYYNVTKIGGGTEADPSKNLVLTAPNVNLTKEDTKKLQISTVLSDYIGEIQKVDPNVFKVRAKVNLAGSAPTLMGDVVATAAKEMNFAEKVSKLNAGLKNDPRFKAINDKYRPVLEKAGIDINNAAQMAEYQSYVSNPENAEKVEVGITLNSLGAEMMFKPDGSGNTVEIGDNGQAFVNGTVRVPARAVDPKIVKVLREKGMISSTENATDELDPKKTTTYYLFKAKLPTEIDLENAGMFFYGDEKDYNKRSYLRQQIGAYLKTEYNTSDFQAVPQPNGGNKFTIKADSPVSNQLSQIDADIYEKMTNGTFDFTAYQTIHNQITSLYNTQFNSRSEAAAAVKELTSRLVSDSVPVSLNEKQARDAQSALTDAVQRPEFNTIKTALEAEGFSPTSTAYWLGNFIQESSLSPTALNQGEGAFGIAQWRLGRRDALESFTGSKNPSVEDQVRFFLYELKQRVGPEEYNRIKNLTSASEIREVIRKYEGYGDEGYRTYFGQLLSQQMTTP